MKKITLILLTIIALSCKKDKLEGDYSILEGRWELSYIVRKTYLNYNNAPSMIISCDTITPTEIGDNYALEFLHKGKLRQIKNDELVREDRVVFQTFIEDHPNSQYDYLCAIRLNNKDNDYFAASFTSNKMSASRAHIEGFDSTTDNFNTISHSFIYIKQ